MEKLLSCPICQEPFWRAVEVKCCSKCYCLQCITKWIADGHNTCPNCREPLSQGDWKDNKPLQQLVDDLPYTCKYQANGCTAVLTRGIAQQHEEKCDYALVPCKYNASQCGTILRKDLEEHLEKCPFRFVKCPQCGALLPPNHIDEHIKSECDMVEQQCPSCSAVLLRKILKSHQCPLLPIECPFNICGCTEKLLPDKMKEHVAVCVSQHLTLTNLTISKLIAAKENIESRLTLLENENKILKQKIQQFEETLQSGDMKSPSQLQLQSPSPSPSPSLPLIVPTNKAQVASSLDTEDDIEREKRISKGLLSNATFFTKSQTTKTISEDIEVGIKVMMQLPAELQQRYAKIINKPFLIVENLILEERIDLLGKVFAFMNELKNDDILIYYAKKALSFDKNKLIEPTSMQSIDTRKLMLSGEEEEDVKIRKQFAFSKAPDAKLAKSLLDLCSNPIRAAYLCLEMYQLYQSDFVYTPNMNYVLALRVVEMLPEILNYAKIQFMKTHEAASGVVELCDTFLSHVNLLATIVKLRTKCVISLTDLVDPAKARKLRDKLIVDEQFEVAKAVAVQCHIEVDVVWIAWGFHWLRCNQFVQAREAFARCLVPIDFKNSKELTPTKRGPLTLRQSSIDTMHIVDSIVSILDATSSPTVIDPTPSAEQLQPLSEITQVERSNEPLSSTSLTPENTVKRELDNRKLNEAIYYLEKYGRPESALSFFLRHKMLERACRYVFERKLPSNLFIEHIVEFCSTHSLLPELKQTLKKIDPTLESFHNYLLAACKYFNQQKAFKTLVTFQIFMKDYVRAGLTCIKIFLDTLDHNYKLKCLEVAKGYFQEGLRLIKEAKLDSSDDPMLNEVEILKYINKINLQVAVLNFLKDRYNEIKIDGFAQFSLFGPIQQRIVLAEYIILHNPQLAIEIMEESKLDKANLYMTAIRTFAKLAVSYSKGVTSSSQNNANSCNANQLSFELYRTEQFLKAIRATVTDSQWDTLINEFVNIYAQGVPDPDTCLKTMDPFILKLVSPKSKVRAYIVCGKLKTAYLMAVKLADIELVDEILQEAQKTQQHTIENLCLKYLETHANKSNVTKIK